MSVSAGMTPLDNVDDLEDFDERRLEILQEALGSDACKEDCIAERNRLNRKRQASVARAIDRLKRLHASFDRLNNALRQRMFDREIMHLEWEDAVEAVAEVDEAIVAEDARFGAWEADLVDHLAFWREELRRTKDLSKTEFTLNANAEVLFTEKTRLAQSQLLRELDMIQELFDEACSLAVCILLLNSRPHVDNAGRLVLQEVGQAHIGRVRRGG